MLKCCERCLENVDVFRMSYFNTQMICMKCVEKERKHHLFKYAKEVENEEVKRGNYNFEGIGLPNDL